MVPVFFSVWKIKSPAPGPEPVTVPEITAAVQVLIVLATFEVSAILTKSLLQTGGCGELVSAGRGLTFTVMLTLSPTHPNPPLTTGSKVYVTVCTDVVGLFHTSVID